MNRTPISSSMAPGTFDRRSFLSAGVLLGAGLVAAPLLGACSKSTDVPAGGGTGGGTAAAPANLGTKTTVFPSKLWKPSDTVGAKPDLPRRIAFQNVVSGAAALDLTDKWLHRAADDIKFEYLTANSQGNSAATITQMKQSIARGIMGMVAPGQDIPAQVAAMQTNMAKGGAMFLFNSGSITCGMAAVQYTFGYTQGKFAAAYIKNSLWAATRRSCSSTRTAVSPCGRERPASSTPWLRPASPKS